MENGQIVVVFRPQCLLMVLLALFGRAVLHPVSIILALDSEARSCLEASDTTAGFDTRWSKALYRQTIAPYGGENNRNHTGDSPGSQNRDLRSKRLPDRPAIW